MTFSFFFFYAHLFSSLITFYLRFDLLLPNRNCFFFFLFLFSYIFFFLVFELSLFISFSSSPVPQYTHTHTLYIFSFFFSSLSNAIVMVSLPPSLFVCEKKNLKETKEYKITWLLVLFCYQPYLSEPPAGNQYMLVFFVFFFFFDVFWRRTALAQCHLEKTNRSNVLTNHPVCKFI